MQSWRSDAGLIVFLRLPERGKVKTRLAASVGDDQALEIYMQLISATLEQVAKLQVPTYLFYEGGLPDPTERNPIFEYHPQAAGDLGAKMRHAISAVLMRHTKAIIIGSDCPGLSMDLLEESFRQLDQYDIVIGPATDGGYYLLGCKKPYPEIFEGIKWSTSSVLEDSIESINALGLTYVLMELLQDIDTAEDWDQYKETRLPDR